MSLLAPWFLLGLVAIGVPLWLHRMSRDDPRRRPFGSVRFLERAELQTSTRSSLRYLLLLATRIALLLLLALLFARPAIETTRVLGGELSNHHLLVIDTSMSMQAGNRRERAVDAARDLLTDLPITDTVQLVAAGDRPTILNAADADRSELTTLLQTLQPASLRLDYGQLMAALKPLAEGGERPTHLHFITDAQESALPINFADLAPSAFSSFELARIDDADVVNAGLSGTIARRGGQSVVMATVTSSSTRAAALEVPVRTLSVRVNGSEIERRELLLDTPHITVELPLAELESGDNAIELQLSPGDDLAADDRLYLVAHRAEPAPVALFSALPDGSDLLYVRTALESQRDRDFALTELNAAIVDDYPLADFRFVVVADYGALSVGNRDRLVRYLESGGRVLLASGARSSGTGDLQVGPVALQGTLRSVANRAEPARISRIQAHPALEQLSTWQEARVEQYLQVSDDGADVLMRLDNGDPLLLEYRVGSGELILLATGLDARWSNLPITTGFVAFLEGIAAYLDGSGMQTNALVAGTALPLQQRDGTIGQVFAPDGDPMLTLQESGSRAAIELSAPGIYRLQTNRDSRLLAVNSDSRESDLSPLDEAAIERWRRLPTANDAASTRLAMEQRTASRELWPWLIALFALFVIIESLLANRHLAIRRESA